MGWTSVKDTHNIALLPARLQVTCRLPYFAAEARNSVLAEHSTLASHSRFILRISNLWNYSIFGCEANQEWLRDLFVQNIAMTRDFIYIKDDKAVQIDVREESAA